jgi:hypothetical protein
MGYQRHTGCLGSYLTLSYSFWRIRCYRGPRREDYMASEYDCLPGIGADGLFHRFNNCCLDSSIQIPRPHTVGNACKSFISDLGVDNSSLRRGDGLRPPLRSMVGWWPFCVRTGTVDELYIATTIFAKAHFACRTIAGIAPYAPQRTSVDSAHISLPCAGTLGASGCSSRLSCRTQILANEGRR